MENNSNKSAAESHPARAIQIVCPNNHKFQINEKELNQIQDLIAIKDHHVVVVSVAGAFRKGKSFLLNFFLKYLNARYKKHDVADWLGELTAENGNSDELSGFKWRGGQKPETTGFWMWSEIFTHEFSDGEQVAIILLDTQGIFDHQSNRRDFTATFALSMLLASVQCYNIMRNVQEDDLENMDMLTEYGRLLLEQTHARPFQKLLFIIRDWPNAIETGYGWNGRQVIDGILAEDESQTSENRQLRDRIKSSFEEINAFLMPDPGKYVAQGRNPTGKLQQIDPQFIQYIKELVPAIFAPENLVVKKINNERVRVGDLFKYLLVYVNIFNGETLPKPTTLLQATAEVNNSILYQECLSFYEDSMQKAMEDASPCYSDSELQNIHENLKDKTMQKFADKPKLGGDNLASEFFEQLERDIEHKFLSFQRENAMKRNNSIIQEHAAKTAQMVEDLKVRMDSLQKDKDAITAELYEQKRHFLEKEFNISQNYALRDELKATFENNMIKKIGNAHLNHNYLIQIFGETKATILQNFDSRKMGDDDVTGNIRQSLECDIDNLLPSLERWNESNKPQPDNPQQRAGFLGALIGSRFGPVGAIIGATMGFISDLFRK